MLNHRSANRPPHINELDCGWKGFMSASSGLWAAGCVSLMTYADLSGREVAYG